MALAILRDYKNTLFLLTTFHAEGNISCDYKILYLPLYVSPLDSPCGHQ